MFILKLPKSERDNQERNEREDRRLFDMSRFRFRAYARGLGHVHLVIRRN